VRLVVMQPHTHMSLQKHDQRSEFWFVLNGQATVHTLDSSSDIELLGVFAKHGQVQVSTGQWHQISNDGDSELRMIEIQYGDDCRDSDVVRMGDGKAT
jgi:mannose-6-phosphate isomerase-like protein (cupin superfamily)